MDNPAKLQLLKYLYSLTGACMTVRGQKLENRG